MCCAAKHLTAAKFPSQISLWRQTGSYRSSRPGRPGPTGEFSFRRLQTHSRARGQSACTTLSGVPRDLRSTCTTGGRQTSNMGHGRVISSRSRSGLINVSPKDMADVPVPGAPCSSGSIGRLVPVRGDEMGGFSVKACLHISQQFWANTRCGSYSLASLSSRRRLISRSLGGTVRASVRVPRRQAGWGIDDGVQAHHRLRRWA
jgi:hypothetical protein